MTWAGMVAVLANVDLAAEDSKEADRKARHRAAVARYRKTDKGRAVERASKQRYQATERVKTLVRERVRRHRAAQKAGM